MPLAWSARIGILLLTLLAFVLRVLNLGAASLSFDEAWDITLGARPPLAMLTDLAAGGLHPPLHYFLIHGLSLVAGQSEWAARFSSLLPGVLIVPLAYAVVRAIYAAHRERAVITLSAGIPAAALLALSPFLIYYAQEARMYSLAACLSLTAVLTLLRATSDRARPALGPWAWHALSLTLLFYTQYLSVFLIPALAVYTALLGRSVFRRWLAALSVAALLWAPWAPAAFAQARRLAARPDFPLATLNPIDVIGRILGSFLPTQSAPVLWSIAVLLAALFVHLGLRWRQAHALAVREALPVLAALFPIVLTGIAASIAPKFASRYAIVALPALYIALAILLSGALSRFRLGTLSYAALVLVAVVASTGPAVRAAQSPWSPQEDARGLAAYLSDRAKDDHAIVLVENAPHAFDYYYHGAAPRTGIHVGFDFAEGAADLNRVLATQPERVWLALWNHEFADPTALVITELQRRSVRPPSARTSHPGYLLLRFDLQDWSPVAAMPAPQHRLDAPFETSLALVGFDRLDNGPESLVWVLYWRALRALDRDYSVAIQLRDATGAVRFTHNQPPSTPFLAGAGFPVGVPVRGLTRPQLPTSLPPGDYDVGALVWDPTELRNLSVLDAAGRPIGISVPLGRIAVTPAMLGR